MASKPLDFEESRPLMMLRTCFAEMKRGGKVDTVRGGEVGSGRPPSSNEELLANSRHRSSALSAEDTAIVSELRLSEGSDDLLLECPTSGFKKHILYTRTFYFSYNAVRI